jgi:hypothetical protein
MMIGTSDRNITSWASQTRSTGCPTRAFSSWSIRSARARVGPVSDRMRSWANHRDRTCFQETGVLRRRRI